MPIMQTITEYDDVMTFGKYKGKTVEWLVDHNPAYLMWLVENKIVQCDDEIHENAIINDANQSPPESWFWEPD